MRGHCGDHGSFQGHGACGIPLPGMPAGSRPCEAQGDSGTKGTGTLPADLPCRGGQGLKDATAVGVTRPRCPAGRRWEMPEPAMHQPGGHARSQPPASPRPLPDPCPLAAGPGRSPAHAPAASQKEKQNLRSVEVSEQLVPADLSRCRATTSW